MTVEPNALSHARVRKKTRHVRRTLSEENTIRHAAAEPAKLGYDGNASIAKPVQCHRHSIGHRMPALDPPPVDPVGERIRQPAAGSNNIEQQQPEVLQDVTKQTRRQSATP